MRKAILLAALCAGLRGEIVINGNRAILGRWDAGGAAATRPAKMGTLLPSTCAAGEVFFKTDAEEGRNLYLCGAENRWTQIAGGGSGGGSGVSLSGNNTYTGANTYQGAVDASGAVSTLPVKVGTALPAACTTGALFFKSDATAGRNLYFCTAGGNPGTWTQMTGAAAPGGLDRSYVEVREDWTSGNTERGHLGNHGWMWWNASIAPSVSYPASDVNHPGVLRCTTGTADLCYVDSGTTYTGLTQTPGWDLQALVRIPDTTSAKVEFGLVGGIVFSGGNSMVMHFDASESPHWQLKTCIDMTCALVDTGVTAAANGWHLLRLRMNAAGTVLGSADGVEVTNSLPLPVAGTSLYIAHSVTALGAVTRSLDVDWTAFRQAVVR